MEKPVYYKSWYQMGISQVDQIVKEQPSTFLSPSEFETKYYTKVCPLTFYGMTSTHRELWKNQKLPSVPLNCKEQESFTYAFLKSKKPSRLAYQKLVELKCNYKKKLNNNNYSWLDKLFIDLFQPQPCRPKSDSAPPGAI